MTGFWCLPDESGSDSDGAESTSSSYSSLSDFVIDIQNSEINGETPGEYTWNKLGLVVVQVELILWGWDKMARISYENCFILIFISF